MKVLLVAVCACAGCLTAAGARVKHTTNDASRYTTCERVGDNIRAYPAAGGPGEALVHARNRAAMLGATHINVLNAGGVMGSVVVEAYKCPTDVGGLQ